MYGDWKGQFWSWFQIRMLVVKNFITNMLWHLLSTTRPSMIRCGASQRTSLWYPLPLGRKAQRLAVPWLAEPLLSGLAPQTGRSFSPDALIQTERHVAFHQSSTQNCQQLNSQLTASTAHQHSQHKPGLRYKPQEGRRICIAKPTEIMKISRQWLWWIV